MSEKRIRENGKTREISPAEPICPCVAAHYYPAWVTGAPGLPVGFSYLEKDFPERLPLGGPYENDDPAVCDEEIRYALEHGVNCFIFCWYRRKENEGKPLSVDHRHCLRLGETLHRGFFRAENFGKMQFAIMYEASPRWGGTDREDLLTHLMPFWISEYFSKPNYLRIDGKPVLFVYDYYGDRVRGAFPDPAEQKEAFDECRQMAKDAGLGGMIFAEECRKFLPDRIDDYRSRGFDFTFAYCWGLKSIPTDPASVIRAQLGKMEEFFSAYPETSVATASCMWDPTPRFSTMPDVYLPEKNLCWKLPPADFGQLLDAVRKRIARLPENAIGRKILMLDNWNEWDEGHYLAPSVSDGFGYLKEIRRALTKSENGPDRE